MTAPAKLTLERLAALDAAACKGPWSFEKRGNAYWLLGEFITAAQDHVYIGEIGGTFDSEGEKNAAFIAASKGAAPILLAALRGLDQRWRLESKDCRSHSADCCCGLLQQSMAEELRHLIETLDLNAPREGQQQ